MQAGCDSTHENGWFWLWNDLDARCSHGRQAPGSAFQPSPSSRKAASQNSPEGAGWLVVHVCTVLIATPPSLRFSVASTANLVGHDTFTSFVDRQKQHKLVKELAWRLNTSPCNSANMALLAEQPTPVSLYTKTFAKGVAFKMEG